MVRLNGTTKSAFGEVKDGIARQERDPFFNPERVVQKENVTETLTNSDQGVMLAFNNGNDYGALQVTLPPGSSTIKNRISFSTKGTYDSNLTFLQSGNEVKLDWSN